MAHFDPERVRELLSVSAATLAAPLSADEVRRVEDCFGFEFCSDHRDLLSVALPVGQRWPDWRHGSEEDLRGRLAWPIDGVLFDVEHDAFWLPTWGDRPYDLAEALSVARSHLRSVPQLVPIYAHRYLPSAPCSSPTPIFSVYQTDVIYYGHDLLDYLDREFRPRSSKGPVAPVEVEVPFWTPLTMGDYDHCRLSGRDRPGDGNHAGRSWWRNGRGQGRG